GNPQPTELGPRFRNLLGIHHARRRKLGVIVGRVGRATHRAARPGIAAPDAVDAARCCLPLVYRVVVGVEVVTINHYVPALYPAASRRTPPAGCKSGITSRVSFLHPHCRPKAGRHRLPSILSARVLKMPRVSPTPNPLPVSQGGGVTRCGPVYRKSW